MTSFWLCPLHAYRSNPPRPTAPPQTQHQLNLTVLNEWNNTELTSRENPPPPPPLASIPSLLRRLLTCQRLWWECPDLCKKSPHCLPMTVSLTIHYGWIPEDSLSLWATVHAQTLMWSYSIEIGEMWIWMKAWESKNVWTGKQQMLYKRLKENVEVYTQTLFYFFRLISQSLLTSPKSQRWGKCALSNASLRSREHP